MLPFDSYPGGGRHLLGEWKGSNARHDYGLELMKLTGQSHCGYCDLDLTANYETWLSFVVEHVIPLSICRANALNRDWYWDLSNAVLACSACNGFCNRFRPDFTISPPNSIEEFYDLRDKIFLRRRERILARHAEEREFFGRKPWAASAGSGH